MAFQIQREHPNSGKIQYYKWFNGERPIFSGKDSAAQLDEKTAQTVHAQLHQLYPDEKITVVGA